MGIFFKPRSTVNEIQQSGRTHVEASALVLIEMQQEWLAKKGKLNSFPKDRQQFESAIKNARKALKLARKQKIPIAHCGLRFLDGHPELGGGRNARAGLTQAIPDFGTFRINHQGSLFAKDFSPKRNEFVVYGRTGASGFASSNLDIWLRNNRLNRVYLAGFALHVCIESTLRHGHDLGYQMVVLEDCCAAFTPDQRTHVLEDIVHHYGKRMTNIEFEQEVGHASWANA